MKRPLHASPRNRFLWASLERGAGILHVFAFSLRKRTFQQNRSLSSRYSVWSEFSVSRARFSQITFYSPGGGGDRGSSACQSGGWFDRNNWQSFRHSACCCCDHSSGRQMQPCAGTKHRPFLLEMFIVVKLKVLSQTGHWLHRISFVSLSLVG